MSCSSSGAAAASSAAGAAGISVASVRRRAAVSCCSAAAAAATASAVSPAPRHRRPRRRARRGPQRASTLRRLRSQPRALRSAAPLAARECLVVVLRHCPHDDSEGPRGGGALKRTSVSGEGGGFQQRVRAAAARRAVQPVERTASRDAAADRRVESRPPTTAAASAAIAAQSRIGAARGVCRPRQRAKVGHEPRARERAKFGGGARAAPSSAAVRRVGVIVPSCEAKAESTARGVDGGRRGDLWLSRRSPARVDPASRGAEEARAARLPSRAPRAEFSSWWSDAARKAPARLRLHCLRLPTKSAAGWSAS